MNFTLKNFFVGITTLLTFGLLCSQGRADARRGQSLYKQCDQCHGKNGEGNKEVGAPRIAGLPAWYVLAQLKNFQGGARGIKSDDTAGLKMRPMARTLKTDSDMQDVAAHVASMKRTIPSDDKLEGSVLLGREQFLVCQSCHGENGQGMEAVFAPPLAGQDPWYLMQQLKNFKEGRRGFDANLDINGATMAGMAAALDDKAMKDLIHYISTFPIEVKP